MALDAQELIEIEVDEEARRLDAYLAARPELELSRTRVKALIETGAVLVDGQAARPKDPVFPGSTITVLFEAKPPPALTPVAMELTIVYEDEHLIVLDKPAGLVVHPGAGDTGPTLVHGLLHHLQATGGGDLARGVQAPERPGIVHRLDKDTSGLMVCAKTDKAHRELARQFAEKTNLREYQALLSGVMAQRERMIESYLARDPKDRTRMASWPLQADEALLPKGARLAKSLFRREEVYGDRLTLARVRLFTGRTHQIRVHARELGMPVVGDPVYGRVLQLPKHFDAEVAAKVKGATRQMLHAGLLGFAHPADGRPMRFESSLPADFAALLSALAPYGEGGETQ